MRCWLLVVLLALPLSLVAGCSGDFQAFQDDVAMAEQEFNYQLHDPNSPVQQTAEAIHDTAKAASEAASKLSFVPGATEAGWILSGIAGAAGGVMGMRNRTHKRVLRSVVRGVENTGPGGDSKASIAEAMRAASITDVGDAVIHKLLVE
jgi:hypothetical protein